MSFITKDLNIVPESFMIDCPKCKRPVTVKPHNTNDVIAVHCPWCDEYLSVCVKLTVSVSFKV